MKSNYQKTITLECPSCTSQDITLNESKSHGICNSCGKEFPGGYDELVELNSMRINKIQETLIKEVKVDVEKDIQKALKDAFRGNKFIKFK